MRRIVVSITAVILTSVATSLAEEPSREPVSKSWGKMLDSSRVVEELKNVPLIVDTLDDGKQIVVTVKNAGESNLIWMGAGNRPTLYQEIFYEGEWHANRWDWCGTGKRVNRLRPGDSVSLKLKFWDPMKKERMLTYFNEEGTLHAALVPLATESRAAQHRPKH